MPFPLPSNWRKPQPPPALPPRTPGEILILAALDIVLQRLETLTSKQETSMATVADVAAALASTESKEATIIGLLQTEQALQVETLAQLKALQASGATDPAALDAIVAKLTADGTAMDAAIASVTPPAPAAA
jgi:hypothetical protein